MLRMLLVSSLRVWCRVQVDVRRCSKVDQRQFLDDHFDLGGNACASLHDNTLALTSVRGPLLLLLPF